MTDRDIKNEDYQNPSINNSREKDSVTEAKYSELPPDIDIDKVNDNIKRNRILLIAGAAAAFLIIIFIICFINDPQRAIDEESAKTYDEAIVSLKNEDYEEAVYLFDTIDDSWSDYDKVPEKRAAAVKELIKNKKNECLESNDYESLIKCINEYAVDPDAEIEQIYDEAISAYKSEVFAKADKAVSEGNYSEAVSYLEYAFDITGLDTEIEQKITQVRKKSILSEVEKYRKKEEYDKAIDYINENIESVDNDADVLAKLNDCKDKYRKQIIERAKTANTKKGYQAAVNIVKEGLKVLPDDKELLAQKKKYEALAPVSLLSIEVFESDYKGSKGHKRVGETLEDKYGKIYENCIEYSFGYKDSRDKYLLDKNFNKFKGTIFVPKHRKSSYDGWDHKDPFHFYIYGDGKLLYKSPKMKSEHKPVNFDVDVSGVELLAINWHGGAVTWDCEIGLANANLYK